jgi:hypothetical protein
MLLITYKPKNPPREPWNKGKLVGPKPPFKLREIWAIRVRLDLEHRIRELAMFNLAIESKLRGCDLVRLKISDVMHGRLAISRALVVQHKTQQPVIETMAGPSRGGPMPPLAFDGESLPGLRR